MLSNNRVSIQYNGDNSELYIVFKKKKKIYSVLFFFSQPRRYYFNSIGERSSRTLFSFRHLFRPQNEFH